MRQGAVPGLPGYAAGFRAAAASTGPIRQRITMGRTAAVS